MTMLASIIAKSSVGMNAISSHLKGIAKFA
jgi:hypothetical protein